MIKSFQDNPLGLALAGACGIFLLVLIGLTAFSAWPLPTAGENADGAVDSGSIELPTLAESPPIENYYVITERPLFSETRQPSLDQDLELTDVGDLEEEDTDAPEVSLSGVIITPSVRMVTLRRKDNNESLVAFEGRPLEGDFGSWQVTQIAEREVTLTSGAGKELQLELQVHDEVIAAPDRPAPRRAREQANEADEELEPLAEDETGEPLTRAEEIRQRIAERREELRRQAEEEQEDGRSSAPASYQEAIQSMISRGRPKKPANENEDQQ